MVLQSEIYRAFITIFFSIFVERYQVTLLIWLSRTNYYRRNLVMLPNVFPIVIVTYLLRGYNHIIWNRVGIFLNSRLPRIAHIEGLQVKFRLDKLLYVIKRLQYLYRSVFSWWCLNGAKYIKFIFIAVFICHRTATYSFLILK
jgi:hypothetical protein